MEIAENKKENKINHMEYLPDMEVIDSGIADEVIKKMNEYNPDEYTKDDVLEALDDVIHLLGTYDITTIRASMGMYLLCKYIHENTDILVLLTGEISDENAKKRIDYLHRINLHKLLPMPAYKKEN